MFLFSIKIFFVSRHRNHERSPRKKNFSFRRHWDVKALRSKMSEKITARIRSIESSLNQLISKYNSLVNTDICSFFIWNHSFFSIYLFFWWHKNGARDYVNSYALLIVQHFNLNFFQSTTLWWQFYLGLWSSNCMSVHFFTK